MDLSRKSNILNASALYFFLKQRSVQVILIIAIYLCLASSLPLFWHQFFYSISIFIKDLLILLLPISITFFIASAIANFEKKAPIFIITLMLFEAISNSCSVWYAYSCANITHNCIPNFTPHQIFDDFSPLWKIPFAKPSWWSADKGTFLGIILGLLAAFNTLSSKQFVFWGKNLAQKTLTLFFAKLIPLFVLGFVARMYKTQILQQILTHYTELLFWLLASLSLYILFLFSLGFGSNVPPLKTRIKNLLPAGLIAFTSGCSLSTMPWTIEGSSKNLENKGLASAIIPATTNIQQIGDCIINCFLCFAIYSHFFGKTPDISTWAIFSTMFVLARFATAAVIGGAIFIMIPIYENYLQFTPEMIAVILAFNVILDPFVTSANVLANGALCRIFEKAWKKTRFHKEIFEKT